MFQCLWGDLLSYAIDDEQTFYLHIGVKYTVIGDGWTCINPLITPSSSILTMSACCDD